MVLNAKLPFVRAPTLRPASRQKALICNSVHAQRTTEEVALRKWIAENGGFIHPSLYLTSNAPCGSRGIVAYKDIHEVDLQQQPLVCVPKTLHLDNHTAASLLKGRVAEQLHEGIEDLEQVQVVAAALALERQLAAGSAWAPYISTLPRDPPSPWLLGPEQLAGRLEEVQQARQSRQTTPTSDRTAESRQQGSREAAAADSGWMQEWRQQAAAAQARYSSMAEEVVELLGGDLQLSWQDVMWGLGQVSSRSLGSGSSSGLVPFVDLLNHNHAARPPMMQLDDNDKVVITCTNVRDGELQPLLAGQELYIAYNGSGEGTPLEAWLKFGFVPQELWASEGQHQ